MEQFYCLESVLCQGASDLERRVINICDKLEIPIDGFTTNRRYMNRAQFTTKNNYNLNFILNAFAADITLIIGSDCVENEKLLIKIMKRFDKPFVYLLVPDIRIENEKEFAQLYRQISYFIYSNQAEKVHIAGKFTERQGNTRFNDLMITSLETFSKVFIERCTWKGNI